jgi:hypothetical protein
MMKYTFISILLFSFPYIVYCQCCTAGNPVGGDGSNDGLNKNELRISASYKYSLSKDYFHKDSKITVPYIDKSYFDYNNLSFTYGLSPRLSLHTELGYFVDKTQDSKMDCENVVINSHGLGDLFFNVRYTAIKTVKPISQLVISAGTKIPVGAFNEDINGVTVPLSLQPSSGALKFNLGTFYSRKRADKKVGWNSFALFEISQTIKKGYLIYRYGNYFQFAFAGTYAVTKNFNFIANAKLEYRSKDERENNIKIESSGSSVVFMNPQFIYNFKYRWGFIAMADIPVYKYMDGYQLTNKFSFQLGIRKSFSFCKKTEV